MDTDEPGGLPPKMPRWVKIAIALGVLALAALLVMVLVVPGGHGPRMHG